MQVELDGQLIDVFITKKNNKNMYLRVKEDGIHISCNYFVTKGMILNFITSNEQMILEAYARLQKKKEKIKMGMKSVISRHATSIVTIFTW